MRDINPTAPLAEPFIKELEAAEGAFGIRVEFLRASTDSEIDASFAGLPHQPGDVMVSAIDARFLHAADKSPRWHCDTLYPQSSMIGLL